MRIKSVEWYKSFDFKKKALDFAHGGSVWLRLWQCFSACKTFGGVWLVCVVDLFLLYTWGHKHSGVKAAVMSLDPDVLGVKSAPPLHFTGSRPVNERGLKAGNDSTSDPETEQSAHMRMKHFFDH